MSRDMIATFRHESVIREGESPVQNTLCLDQISKGTSLTENDLNLQN